MSSQHLIIPLSASSCPSNQSAATTTASSSITTTDDEDPLHVDELRSIPLESKYYGPSKCGYSYGRRTPDTIDTTISTICWTTLVLGLIASLLLSAFDPLTLGSNYLEALYRYLSVIGYFEALLLVILKVAHPAKDAIGRVLKFQSRHIPSTEIVLRGGHTLRLEGNLVYTGLNSAQDSMCIEIVLALAQEFDPTPQTCGDFIALCLQLLDNRRLVSSYDRYVNESVQTIALRFICQAVSLANRNERMNLYHKSFAANLASTQIVSANDGVCAAIARLAIEDAEAAIDLLWHAYQRIIEEEGNVSLSNANTQSNDDSVIVPKACTLRNICIDMLNQTDDHCERVGLRLIVEYINHSLRFGFGEKEQFNALNVLETSSGSLLVKTSFSNILKNEPFYFLLQAISLFLYAAAPWTVALLSSDGSYISKAADAAGIGTAVMAGFAYISETFWPNQRLLWAALRFFADVHSLSRLPRLFEGSMTKVDFVRHLVTQGGFFDPQFPTVCHYPSIHNNLLQEISS